MARYTGKSTLNGTYNVKYYAPLDTRMLVPTYADLTTQSNWMIEGYGSIAYNGMIVAVGSDTDISKNGIYYLFDSTHSKPDDEPTVTLTENWHKVANLSELNELTDRIISLEATIPEISSVSPEELEAAISSLRTEIQTAGYLTADDISGKADLNHTHTLSEISDYEAPDLSNYALKTEIPNVDEFASTDYVDQAIKDIEPVDISGKLDIAIYEEDKATFITNESLNSKGYATETFVTSLGYITAVPSEYITEDELNAKGFITEHQDISGLATKADLDAYATDEDVAAKADKANTLSGYGITDAYTRTEIDDKFTEFAGGGSINLDGYVSEDEWNERIVLFATSEALGSTQAEVDAVEKKLEDNYSTTEQVKTIVNEHVVTTIAYGEF